MYYYIMMDVDGYITNIQVGATDDIDLPGYIVIAEECMFGDVYLDGVLYKRPRDPEDDGIRTINNVYYFYTFDSVS